MNAPAHPAGKGIVKLQQRAACSAFESEHIAVVIIARNWRSVQFSVFSFQWSAGTGQADNSKLTAARKLTGLSPSLPGLSLVEGHWGFIGREGTNAHTKEFSFQSRGSPLPLKTEH
jgi:hypothetical protein